MSVTLVKLIMWELHPFSRFISPPPLESRNAHSLIDLSLLFLVAENTGNVYIEELDVPSPLIYGSSTDLSCKFNWDAEGQQQGRHIYSVKWYKGSHEFYR